MQLNRLSFSLAYNINYSGKEFTETMRQEDYRENWRSLRIKFMQMTSCMSCMVERLMQPVKTKGCWRIEIECMDHDVIDIYTDIAGSYKIRVYVDLYKFFDMDVEAKKRYTVEKMIEALRKLQNLVPFDLSGMLEACEQVKEANYINVWYWANPIRNQNHYVQIKVLHEVERVDISMVFMDADKHVIKEVPLVSSDTREHIYGKYLGELKWLSDISAVLIHESENESYVGHME